MATPDYKAKNQKYLTPPEIYKPVLKFIGKRRFWLDVCCLDKNIPAEFYNFASLTDGLQEKWQRDCWMNPPWDKTEKWLKKAFAEVGANDAEVWCCVPGDRMNSKYFYNLLSQNHNWFGVFLAGRFNFYNPDACVQTNETNKKNGGLNSPVLILYMGKNSDEYEQRWRMEMPIAGIVFS